MNMDTIPNLDGYLLDESSVLLIYADSHRGLGFRKTVIESVSDCEAIIVNDPEQLMPELIKFNVDLLLLDIDIADCNCEAIIRQIRDHFSPLALPILILCFPDAIEKRNLALAVGANDYISKPLDHTEVALRIKNNLAVKNFHKANQAIKNDLEREVRDRTAKLDILVDSGLMMSMERSHAKLLNHILVEGQRLLNCDGGTMYFVTPQKSLLFAIRTKEDTLPFLEIPLYDPDTGKPNEHYVSAYAAIRNKSVIIDDVYQESRFDCSGTRNFDAQCGYRTVSLLTVPMAPRNGQVIGALQFINALDPDTGTVIPFPADSIILVEALAAQAAVALDNLQMIEGQKTTIANIIRLLANVVDSHSGDLFTYQGQQSSDRQEGFS